MVSQYSTTYKQTRWPHLPAQNPPIYDPSGRAIVGRSTPDWNVNIRNPYQTGPMAGRPRTDEERMAMHLARYGNTNIPPRGTRLSTQKLSIDWGTFLAGIIVGGVTTLFLVTATGRRVGAAAGERVARKIRG